MTHKERIDSVNHINEFTINPVPTPNPDDEQTWLADLDDKILRFHAIPVNDKVKESISYVIKVDDITKDRLVSESFYSFLSDMTSPTVIIHGYSELLLLPENSQNLNDEQSYWVEKIKHNCAKLLSLRDSVYDRINT